jgi:hypothetical protein
MLIISWKQVIITAFIFLSVVTFSKLAKIEVSESQLIDERFFPFLLFDVSIRFDI